MNKFLSLTKVLFKTGGSTLVQDGKRKLPKTIAMIALIAVSFLPMIALFIGAAAGSYDYLKRIHQEGLILNFGITIGCIFIFVFGIFYVMATFYFSMDIERLLPLPIKPSIIIGSKFTIVLIYEYLTEIVLLMPILITFGIKSHGGILYYIYSIIIFLTVPVIPLVMGAFISILLMRFTTVARNKDRFKVITGVIAMFLALGVNIVFQRIGRASESPEKMAQLLMQGNNSLTMKASNLFPSGKLAINTLLYSGDLKGFVNLILFIVITIAAIAIMMILGETLYLKGVVGLNQSMSINRKLSEKELEANTVQNSAVKSYIIKELRILYRTPVFFMNCVMMNFLWPIFLLIPIFSQPDMMKQIRSVRMLFRTGHISSYALAAAVGFIIFICGTNPTASTAISREGQGMYINKYLPISYKKQILGKLLCGFILNLIGIVIMIIFASSLLTPPFYLIIQVLILGALADLVMCFIGILIDLAFPKLQWDNEQRAVKNNANVLINMIVGIVLGGLSVLIIILFKFNNWISFIIMFGVYTIIAAVLYVIVTTLGIELYKKIEV